MSISIPGADYTPQLTGYTGQGAFRFWCQKVLPIVYDDSLSYYELLNKVVNYLNNVIADVASVENNIEQLNTSYVNLQRFVNDTNDSIETEINEFEDFMTTEYENFNHLVTAKIHEFQTFLNSYFDNLDVQEEINTKLDEMASDGSLSRLIGPIVAITAPDIITQWLTEHLTPTEPPVDDTLTISGAAADAKVTGEKVTKLKSAFDKTLTVTEASFTWEPGNLSIETGAYVPTDKQNYIRTTTYYNGIGFKFIVPTGYKLRVYKYLDEEYTSFQGCETKNEGTIEIFDPTHYYKFVIFRDPITTIEPSENANIQQYSLLATDTTLTQDDKAADAKTVGNWIKKESKIAIPWEQGEYRTDSGGGRSSSTKLRSIYQVPFRQYISITVPDGYMIKWFQYTGLRYTTFVKSSEWLTGTVKIYEDGKWYKFVVSKTDESTLSPSDVSNLDFNVVVGDVYNTVSNAYKELASVLMLAIMSCYGTVYLKQGTYNVIGTILMQDNQSIIGDGFNTILRFADGATGACIKASNGNLIKNVQIKGRDVDYVLENPSDGQEAVPATMGTRHGIEITGDIRRGIIQNCYIHGFDGFAVYAHDNSAGSNQGWSITDSYFTNNHGGIYLKNSEFYRITGCDCNINYIGMFNGGGNNTIDACNFSSNHYGINMDNSDGTSTNNSHGSITGCILQHNRINAILIDNMAAGEVITGCNIDNGGVKIKDSYRIIFSACNFMNAFSVEITNGGLVMFIGCNMRDYTLNHTIITNNNAVKFINCYGAGGSLIDPTAT